jgi:hypothetical protein
MNSSMPDSSTILRETWSNGTTLLAYPNRTSPAVYFTGYMQPCAIEDADVLHGLASFTTDMLMTGIKRLNFQHCTIRSKALVLPYRWHRASLHYFFWSVPQGRP